MNAPFDWRDMLRFDKMIAPAFLTILYYIAIGGVVLAGLKLVFEGMDTPYYGSKMVMGGLALMVVGPFIIRLYIELLIVIFKIHSRLSNIDHSLRGQGFEAAVESGTKPQPATPRNDPFGQPGGPATAPYSANYQNYEQSGYVRPAANPVAESAPQQPIGFQVSAAEPSPEVASPASGPAMPDFWSPGEFTSSGPSQPVPAVDLKNLSQKVPNWPAVLVSILALYAMVTPYATIGMDLPLVGNLLGDALGNSYTIKNSPLGVLTILGALVMLGTSAGGLKWLWFVIGYAVALLGSVFAFLSDSSLFSQMAKVKSGMAQAGSTFGQFVPDAERISNQMVKNAPSASQFLNMNFYLFIITMVFLGFWALGGKYQEKGFMAPNA